MIDYLWYCDVILFWMIICDAITRSFYIKNIYLFGFS